MSEYIRYLSRITFWLALCCVLGTLLIVSFEVGARYLFNSPTQSSLEITEYLLVAIGFLPLASIYADRAHVSVDLVTKFFSFKTQRVCNGLSLLVSLLFGILVFWFGFKMTLHAYTSGTNSSSLLAFPMWIAYSVIPLGFLAFALESLSQLVDLIKTGSAN